MLLDISDLISKKKMHKEVDVSFKGNNIIFEGEEVVFIDPINIKGIFRLTGDIINFDGTAKTTLNLACSRCLENFNYPIEIEIHEKFSKFNHEDDENSEIIMINNDKVDFSPVIETNTILSLPIKKLCSEDCKGLCSECGTNLNHSNCNCERNDVDPRLVKLREFFSNN